MARKKKKAKIEFYYGGKDKESLAALAAVKDWGIKCRIIFSPDYEKPVLCFNTYPYKSFVGLKEIKRAIAEYPLDKPNDEYDYYLRDIGF